jgi:hypothetical protein
VCTRAGLYGGSRDKVYQLRLSGGALQSPGACRAAKERVFEGVYFVQAQRLDDGGGNESTRRTWLGMCRPKHESRADSPLPTPRLFSLTFIRRSGACALRVQQANTKGEKG